jgi:hypothetical protein
MLNGKVIEVNPRRGMFIVAIDGGDYATFELLDSIEVEVDDSVQGPLNALGGVDLLHVEQDSTISVYGQSGPSSLNACKRLL